MQKHHRGIKDIGALKKALADSEVLLEEDDTDKKQIGAAIKRAVKKSLLKREQEIRDAAKKTANEKFKKTGYYTHAEATAPKD